MIGPLLIADGSPRRGGQARVARMPWTDIAGPVVRRAVMVTLAALAILILLPAAIAAQGSIPI